MSSNGHYEAVDDLEAILESIGDDEAVDYSERSPSRGRGRGGRSWSPPPSRTPGSSMPPKPSADVVTETRLRAVVAQIDGKIDTVTKSIGAVNARVDKLGDDIGRLTTVVKKQAEQQKQDMNNLKNSMQMFALLPLLSSGTADRNVTDAVQGTDLQKGDKIVIDKGGGLNAILPLLLLSGGMTSSDGSSGGGGSSNDPMGGNNMLLLALVLGGGLGGK